MVSSDMLCDLQTKLGLRPQLQAYLTALFLLDLELQAEATTGNTDRPRAGNEQTGIARRGARRESEAGQELREVEGHREVMATESTLSP